MLKIATGFSCLIAAFSAMFIASVVLPMDGRPATIIKSESCSPAVFSSKSLKPVGIPVMSPSCLANSPSFSMASLIATWMVTNDAPVRRSWSAMANTFRSASSSNSRLLRPSEEKAPEVISAPTSTSCRKMDLSRTISA